MFGRMLIWPLLDDVPVGSKPTPRHPRTFLFFFQGNKQCMILYAELGTTILIVLIEYQHYLSWIFHSNEDKSWGSAFEGMDDGHEDGEIFNKNSRCDHGESMDRFWLHIYPLIYTGVYPFKMNGCSRRSLWRYSRKPHEGFKPQLHLALKLWNSTNSPIKPISMLAPKLNCTSEWG